MSLILFAKLNASVVIPVSSINVLPNDTTLTKGSEVTLAATVLPSDATDKTYTWSSSDETVATVDNAGKVTALKKGSSTITATTTDGNKTASCVVTVVQPVTGVSLNTSQATVFIGGTLQLSANVSPSDADVKTIIWSSSDESVASVDNTGKVTATQKSGTTTIKAKTADGGFEATCNVTATANIIVNFEDAQTSVGGWAGWAGQICDVRANPKIADPNTSSKAMFMTKKMFWNGATITGFPNAGFDIQKYSKASFMLYADTIPETHEISNIAVQFIVQYNVPANANLFELNDAGNGPKVDAGNNVKLGAFSYQISEGTGITLTEKAWLKVDFPFNGKLKCSTKYWDANTNTAVTNLDGKSWLEVPANFSSITNIQFAIDNRWITGKNDNGTARLGSGIYIDELEFAANMNVTSVTLDKNKASIKKGESLTLAATIIPTYAEVKTVTWNSSDDAIATVDNAGKVTAVNTGECTITVTTTDGNKTASCVVTVVQPVTGIEVEPLTASLKVGEFTTLAATIKPAEATDKTYKWSSSDELIASVDQTGKVIGVKAGECTITATSNDGSKTASCTVTVKQPATGIEVSPTTASIKVGENVTLSATVKPADASDKTFEWSSSDESIATVDQTGKVTGIKVGVCNIFATTTDGAKTASCELTVNSGDAISAANNATFALYPNPVNNGIVSLKGNFTDSKLVITIYDISGKAVKSFNETVAGSNVKLNVSSLASGTYIVSVIGSNNAQNIRLEVK
jgi:uncharacterized protein YjdB